MSGPTTVRFTEEMRGHVAFGEGNHETGAREGRASGTRLIFRLTIEVDDLDRFAADEMRGAAARGWVRCEALGGRLLVDGGVFNLLVDEAGSSRKRMLYRLFFQDGVGHPLTLSGFKVLGAPPGVRVWRDTTTLYTRILRGHVEADDEPRSEVVASGILRLGVPAFLRQLTTFRASGDSYADRAAAVRRFDSLFLGGLWQVYGRRFAAIRDAAANAGRRLWRRKRR